MPPVIRPFVRRDAPATLAVFYAAIRTTAAADYTAAQIAAWAADDIGPAQWMERRLLADTVVAQVGEEVVGFTDVSPTGYIDMLFVHPDHVRRGVATALLEWARSTAIAHGAAILTTHSSVTARPFFHAHGFTVEAERRPMLRGVELINFGMSRAI